MANIDLCKGIFFGASLPFHRYRFAILTLKIKLRSRSRSIALAMMTFDCVYLPLKSHSTYFRAIALAVYEMLTFYLLTMKILVKVTEYNNRSDAGRWLLSASNQVLICISAPALAVFNLFNLDLGQDHRAQHSPC